MKQIMFAMHNYHDMYKSFPTATVLGPDGKTVHVRASSCYRFLKASRRICTTAIAWTNRGTASTTRA